MNDADKTRFRAVLKSITDLFGKTEMNNMGLRLYFNALKAYPLSAVITAIEAHVQNPDTGQYMPKPADIIRHIEGGNEDQGLLAWTKFEQAARRIGAYQTVVFDDALIHAVIQDMGGWIRLGTSTEDNWPFLHNEFVQRYRAYANQQLPIQYPRRLVGMIESQNQHNGHLDAIPTPVLVGDERKAMLVLNADRQDTPDIALQKQCALPQTLFKHFDLQSDRSRAQCNKG